MAGKSPDAFRTISEVADWSWTAPLHVLRFWKASFTQVNRSSAPAGALYGPRILLLLGRHQKTVA